MIGCIECKENKEGTIQAGNHNICPECLLKVKQGWVVLVNSNKEYTHCTFESFQGIANKKAVFTCKDFSVAKDDRFGLLLFSVQAGNGKTHLAISTLKAWIMNKAIPDYNLGISKRVPFEVITEPSLLLRIRASFCDSSAEQEGQIIERFGSVPFLLIDDVGKYESADLKFLQRIMFSIINERYLHHRLTLITSNKSGAELERYLGDYTFDRICGMTNNKITAVVGESYRKNKIAK